MDDLAHALESVNEAPRYESTTWYVPSNSKPGKMRTVRVSMTCDCPGFQYRKHCRHVQEIQNAG